MGNRVSRLRADVKLGRVSEGESPDWVRDGLRQLADEVRLFLRTVVEFTLHPARFGREWTSGARHALNPLGFLATALAVAGPVNVLFAHLVRSSDEPLSLWREALAAVTPFGYYLALGALQHAVLRAFGSRRRLRDSCAMALYAGGGPALIAHILVLTIAVGLYRATGQLSANDLHRPAELAVILGAMLSFGLFLACLSIAQGGLHARYGVRSWHITVANFVALLVTASFFALVRPPGQFGLHLVLGPSFDHGAWHFSWSLSD